MYMINIAFGALAILHLTYLGSVFNSSVDFMEEDEVRHDKSMPSPRGKWTFCRIEPEKRLEKEHFKGANRVKCEIKLMVFKIFRYYSCVYD